MVRAPLSGAGEATRQESPRLSLAESDCPPVTTQTLPSRALHDDLSLSLSRQACNLSVIYCH
jgi:hypothetical protein